MPAIFNVNFWEQKNGTLWFPLTNWLVKVVHYTLTNKTAVFSAPASTKWRSSNNTLSASPVFGLGSNCILFVIYLPQQKRRGRQVIRISVFDFSSFKGVFVNVGRWWLRLYFSRLVLSGAPLVLAQFGPRVSSGAQFTCLKVTEVRFVRAKWRVWKPYRNCVDISKV